MLTNEVATILHLSRRQVQTLIEQGKLPAHKIGRDWWIEPQDLAVFAKVPRRVGRSKKENIK